MRDLSTLLIFAVGWALYGLPLLSFFSVKCFNPLQLYHLSGNVLRKRFTSYFLFIGEHLLKYCSSIVNLTAVTADLLTS